MKIEMETRIEWVLTAAKERSLFSAFNEYADLICSAPQTRFRTNKYNSYTQIGHATVKNPNYNAEITKWKREKLFPWFVEQGFAKKELNEAWKLWVKKYKK
jgi:hypothetical protein